MVRRAGLVFLAGLDGVVEASAGDVAMEFVLGMGAEEHVGEDLAQR